MKCASRELRYLGLLWIFFASLQSFSQKIKGHVTDIDGKPLSFASVYVKGSNKGTNANSEGKFSLQLTPGKYVIVCQYVGFQKEELAVNLNDQDQEINFILRLQALVLSEAIIKSGEDPAYQIIRNAIKKRSYYKDLPRQFQCQVYTKGQLRVRNYPKKLLGQKVDFEDGDTSKQKVLYLSETISNFFVDKPKNEKVEVISSRVSGQSDGYGLSAPQFFSFYDNIVFIGNNLNPRGFVSPIADNALTNYRYKLEGTSFEDSNLVNRIKVTPKRKYEPLFYGYVNIVEDDWSVHSLNLTLTKESQLQLLDTLCIEQLYRPHSGNIWFISSQVIYPAVKFLGFDAYGSFVNVYSGLNTEPVFTKKTFGNTILKYKDSANKRTIEYWEQNRPLPLMADEMRDYEKKDSLEKARKDPRYLDSLERRRNKLTLQKLLLSGLSFSKEARRTSLQLDPLPEQINFNAAEGWVINTGFSWSKRLNITSSGRKRITLESNFRYGFANKHFNTHLKATYTYGKKYASSISFAGGKRVFQFNNNSPIGERGNTLSSLLSEENRIKSYEAIFFRGSYRKGIGNGFTWTLGFQYQDRFPLDNCTNYTWRNKAERSYTPNYPFEIVNENIKRHQVFYSLLSLTWQPGTRYIELPDRKLNIGSKSPVFSISYIRSFSNFLGSDADFSKWRLSVRDEINLKLLGIFRYKIGTGGFMYNRKVELPDYNHFNGNISNFATEYLNSFQLLPIYQYSNTSRLYGLLHAEYNFKGFITNKIPLIRKLNLYLVAGVNAFYLSTDKTTYFEISAGIDNFLKQIRIDYVQSYLNGKPWMSGFKIGLSVLRGQQGDDWP